MVKPLLMVNAILTLPFGIAALVAPTKVFAAFGVQLDAGGALIARGYSATLIAYGILLFLTRQTTDRAVVNALLLSTIAFNAIEAVIQGIAGIDGVAQSVIFGNVAVHGVVGVLCALAWVKQTRDG